MLSRLFQFLFLNITFPAMSAPFPAVSLDVTELSPRLHDHIAFPNKGGYLPG